MQELKVNLLAEGLRIVIVASRFNEMIVDRLIEGASDTFRQFGGSPDDLMLAEADTSPSFGTMADIASIQVQPVSSSPVDIEILVASV